MKKFVKILFLIILVLICAAIYFDWQYENAPAPQWGLNFSTTKPAYLGLDWQKMYHEILSDLKPQRLRVMAYWEVIEPRPGEFNFADIDYILTEAGKRDIKVILTLGHKQPGWPECHHPEWYDKLPEEQRKQAILKVIEDSAKANQFSRVKTVWLEIGALAGVHMFVAFFLMATTGPALATFTRHRGWPLRRERVFVVLAVLAEAEAEVLVLSETTLSLIP